MSGQLNTNSLDRLRDAPLGVCSDEFLARRAARGDSRAFALIYKRHEPGLYRYSRSLVGSSEDAADVLQGAMWLALRALDNGTRPLAIKPWLYRIVHNESMSLLRRRKPEVELAPEQQSPQLSVAHESPHAEVTSRATVRKLFSDLKELTEQQRATLIMRELNDCKPDEIASSLGISPQGVRQTLYEARRSLQEFEEGRALDCEVVQTKIESGDGRKLSSRKVLAHLRDCHACEAFKTAIADPPRRAKLAAFSPAALPGLFLSWIGSLFGAGGPTVAGGAAAGSSGGLAVAGSTAAGLVGAKGLAIASAAVLAAGIGTQMGGGDDGVQDARTSKPQAAQVMAVPPSAIVGPGFDPFATQRERTGTAREAAQRRAQRKVAQRRAEQRRDVARAPSRSVGPRGALDKRPTETGLGLGRTRVDPPAGGVKGDQPRKQEALERKPTVEQRRKSVDAQPREAQPVLPPTSGESKTPVEAGGPLEGAPSALPEVAPQAAPNAVS